MAECWTVFMCVLFMFVLNLVLGSNTTSVCDKQFACLANRPKRQDGCCPLLGGEQCGSGADQQCDTELGYNCTNGICKGKSDLKVVSVEQTTVKMTWTPFLTEQRYFEYSVLYTTDFSLSLLQWNSHGVENRTEVTLFELVPDTWYFSRIGIWTAGNYSNLTETIVFKTKARDYCLYDGLKITVGQKLVVEQCEEARLTTLPAMAAESDAVKTARAALQDQRYFDGVQIVNGALEVQQGVLTKIQCGGYATEDKQEILKNPETFLKRVLPELDEAKRKHLAELFVLRTDLLMGLGAFKRAVLDISAALLLAPDEALAKKKTDIEGLLKTGMSASEGSAKTPTTIITGFLGAGKTTLLNYILDANHGKKIAIIENEFGEVGIDDSLLNTKSSVTEENVIEMNNGCICCTVRGDLIAGLKKLHKQTTGKGKPLDGIIIETTGLADPAPVAQTFFADEFVSANMMLDGILTVVDSKHIVGQLQEEKPQGAVNEAVEQIAFADRILLNKTDLVDEPALDKVESEIRRINNTAAIRKTQNSRVDMEFILGIQAFSLEKVLMQISQSVEEEADAHGHGHHGHEGHEGHESHEGHSHSHGHGEDCKECDHSSHKRHDYRVSSVGIQRDKEVQKDKLDSFINWLIQTKGPDLYRSKGVLAVCGMPQKYVFHAVHMQFSGRQHEAWGDEKRHCKMVFIGKNLDREELNKKFDECLVK